MNGAPTYREFLRAAREAHNPDWPLELYEGTTYTEGGRTRQYLVLCRAGAHGRDPLGRVVIDEASGTVTGFTPMDHLAYGTAMALIRLVTGGVA